MSEPVVELDNVAVCQAGRSLLQEVSLVIPLGAFVAVLGPNGAGKTSLLRVLDGELPLATGRRRILGCDPGALDWRAAARWRQRIGVMPQLAERAPPVPLSVREVVGIAGVARAAGAGPAPVEHWLERLELAALADRPFQRLSGGEQRRTHLARVFAQEPSLVLLDEPAGHLDFPAQEALVVLLHDLWRESRVTIVLVTHELRHLPPGLSHVVLLREGRIIRQGAPEDTLTAAALSETYGRTVEVYRHRGRWAATAEVGDA
jgi:ABC-type cobalamin/Fe3+-siderophores transport system ATPase subunit